MGLFSSKQPDSPNAPYTSSVDIWTKRKLLFLSAGSVFQYSRDASKSTYDPTILVSINSAGLLMELSTCDSAAKWTTASMECSLRRDFTNGPSAILPMTSL